MAKIFSHSTSEITFNDHQCTQFATYTCQMTWNIGNVHHTMVFGTTNTSCDHQGFHDRKSFWSDSSFNSSFPHEYHNNHLHNPNITLNCLEATPVEQTRYAVNEASLLVTVMVDQPIIYTAIFSVETFDGNKNRFEVWIVSAENAAQIYSQDILRIAFSKMAGSSLTSAHRLRDRSPNLTWG